MIDVSDFVDKKMHVIKAYNSQFFNPESAEPNTPISSEDFFDFLKGTERYKYDLGGNSVQLYDLTMNI